MHKEKLISNIEKNPLTLTTLGTLGVSYLNLHKEKKALEIFQKKYELCCEVLGEEHPETLSALNNLALSYKRIDKRKALELHEKAYTLCREVSGEKHPDTLDVLVNLAFSYGAVGMTQKALALCEKAYQLCCEVLGKEHPTTLICLRNREDLYKKFNNK